jgi:hypothetical protein
MRHDTDDDAFDEHGILKDGRSYRVRMTARDSLTPVQRAIASRRQLSDQEAASCRPGFRYGSRPASDRQNLYDAYDAEVSNMWQTGFGGTGAGSHGPRQQPPEGSSCTRDGFPGVWRRGADGDMVCDIAAARRSDAKTRLRSRIDPDEEEDDDDNGDAVEQHRSDDGRSVAQIAADHQRSMARIYDALDAELRAAYRDVKSWAATPANWSNASPAVSPTARHRPTL